MKRRLDRLVVERGLAVSRSQAVDLIRRGFIQVNGGVQCKSGIMLDETDVKLERVGAETSLVSRAAEKLLAGLDHFSINPHGSTALDLGASTGGFTQVLLRAGASKVTAVDVGQAQFHESLRDDPRITLFENLNARNLTKNHLVSPPNLIVADLSFISLTKALLPALVLCAPCCDSVLLFKPQFEVGRQYIGKKGVVRDNTVIAKSLDKVCMWLSSCEGWCVLGTVRSPIKGANGNQEILIGARRKSKT